MIASHILLCMMLLVSFPENSSSKWVIAENLNNSGATNEWVDLKLLNNSDKSIKLHIPHVMNPNLSPHSESGVSIEVGTMVYFYVKKKKYELVEITSDMEKIVIVDELVRKRKSELGL